MSLGSDKFTKMINKIYDSDEILEDIIRSIFIVLPKKPGTNEYQIHQTINLSHIKPGETYYVICWDIPNLE